MVVYWLVLIRLSRLQALQAKAIVASGRDLLVAGFAGRVYFDCPHLDLQPFRMALADGFSFSLRTPFVPVRMSPIGCRTASTRTRFLRIFGILRLFGILAVVHPVNVVDGRETELVGPLIHVDRTSGRLYTRAFR